MNLNRVTKTCRRFNLPSIAILLTALGLILSLAPSASASTRVPALSLDLQFFGAIGSESSLYVVSPGAMLHTPEGDFVGRSGLSWFGDELETYFSDVEFSTTSVEQAGNLTIIEFTLSGINTGSYHGADANCAGIVVPGVAVLQMSQVDPGYGDGPQYRQTSAEAMIVEQWIGYSTESIDSQISAFNSIDAGSRPGCGDSGVPAQDEDPDDELPPSCLPNRNCSLPF